MLNGLQIKKAQEQALALLQKAHIVLSDDETSSIDRFMSEARALTNLIGNGVATVVVSKWENELDHEQLERMMNRDVEAELDAEATLSHTT